MLSLPQPVQIYLAVQPADMRRSFDGLVAHVRDWLGHDPLSGHLFVFRSRRGDRVKILFWDRDGLVLYYKKLESWYPHFFLFTESGEYPDNLARRPIAVGGMDSVSTRNGPRRRPMLSDIAVPAPPRAKFSAIPEVSPSCGVG